MNTSISRFIQNLSEISDPDYGDFMRKANHYLLELETETKKIASERILAHLANMKDDIQFNPNWDIESTRKKVILEAEKINAVFKEELFLVKKSSEDSNLQREL